MLRKILDHLPYVGRLRGHVRTMMAHIGTLQQEVAALRTELHALNAQVAAQGMFPAGHYYSPIPSADDVRAYLARRRMPTGEVPGIRMHADAQRTLLLEFATRYRDVDFPEQRTQGRRYYYDNPWFIYADAFLLHGFLRKYAPKRIVEVGSGFSSAAMLDTIDRHFAERPQLTFIEPYPERLLGLLSDADRQQVILLDKNIQEVPLDLFRQLQSGDLLFIDSSHVVKTGSDLQFILFEVLPCLQSGVFVHFHDVFHPFDYPDAWLTEGRYWNENYFLRAFLASNDEWQIRQFGSYVHHAFPELIAEHLPPAMRIPGGSLYLQRALA